LDSTLLLVGAIVVWVLNAEAECDQTVRKGLAQGMGKEEAKGLLQPHVNLGESGNLTLLSMGSGPSSCPGTPQFPLPAPPFLSLSLYAMCAAEQEGGWSVAMFPGSSCNAPQPQIRDICTARGRVHPTVPRASAAAASHNSQCLSSLLACGFTIVARSFQDFFPRFLSQNACRGNSAPCFK